MENQSANAVPAGVSANEHSQGPTASSMPPASCFQTSFNTFVTKRLDSLRFSYVYRQSYTWWGKTVSYELLPDYSKNSLTIAKTRVNYIRRRNEDVSALGGRWRYVVMNSYYNPGADGWRGEDDVRWWNNNAYYEKEKGVYLWAHGYRWRKVDIDANGEMKTFAFKEAKGVKDVIARHPKTLAGLNAMRMDLGGQYTPYLVLDKTHPTHDVWEEVVSLVFVPVRLWDIEREGTGPVTRVNPRETKLLFLKKEEYVNGKLRGSWDYEFMMPIRVEFSEFGTKGQFVPLFACQMAEMVREQRGELKRELAEKVFHPERVSRMMETYGEDWDEKV